MKKKIFHCFDHHISHEHTYIMVIKFQSYIFSFQKIIRIRTHMHRYIIKIHTVRILNPVANIFCHQFNMWSTASTGSLVAEDCTTLVRMVDWYNSSELVVVVVLLKLLVFPVVPFGWWGLCCPWGASLVCSRWYPWPSTSPWVWSPSSFAAVLKWLRNRTSCTACIALRNRRLALKDFILGLQHINNNTHHTHSL